MAIILDKFPDIVSSRNTSTIASCPQKSSLNIPDACPVCSSTEQNCSHRNRVCPDHPTALLVQDYNCHDCLCSVCGNILASDLDLTINKRYKGQNSTSDALLHNSTTTALTNKQTKQTLLKLYQDPSMPKKTPSSVKQTNILQGVHNQALTLTPPTSITSSISTTTTVVATEPEKQVLSSLKSTMVQHIEQDSLQLTTPPLSLTKTGKAKKKITHQQKKGATKKQLITGQSYCVKDAVSGAYLQQSKNPKVGRPTNSSVTIKDEPLDEDDISVTATTMGNNNIPALAPWPYKLEQIDSGDTSTSTATTTTTTTSTNVTKKKISGTVAKAMLNGIAKLEQLARDINAPISLGQNASTLFKRVYESGLLRNRPVDIMASTCLYITCRQEGVPRTFQEIAQISKVSKKELGRSFKIVLRMLDTPVDVITTKDFMCRFCHALGLGGELMEAAQYIATEAAKLDLVAGRSPVSVAAAAIYVATQASSEPRSASDIGVASGVSEATIFSVYRSIYPHARELFPTNFRFHTSIENLPTQRVPFQ